MDTMSKMTLKELRDLLNSIDLDSINSDFISVISVCEPMEEEAYILDDILATAFVCDPEGKGKPYLRMYTNGAINHLAEVLE